MMEALVFLVVVGLIAIVGLTIGMLVAPRLGRLTERDDEDDGDRTDRDPGA
jgi:hypothetical protein